MGNKGRKEDKSYALAEEAQASCIDLTYRINDGSKESIMGELNDAILSGEPIDPRKAKSWFKEIYYEVAAIGAQIAGFRKSM